MMCVLVLKCYEVKSGKLIIIQLQYGYVINRIVRVHDTLLAIRHHYLCKMLCAHTVLILLLYINCLT